MNGSKTANPNRLAYPPAEIVARLGYAAWMVVRIPILALLIVLEPVVSFVLTGLSLLGILTALFWKWTSADPRFPFWTMLALSIGFAVVLILYERLISLLSRR